MSIGILGIFMRGNSAMLLFTPVRAQPFFKQFAAFSPSANSLDSLILSREVLAYEDCGFRGMAISVPN